MNDIDLLAIGETLVDFISANQVDSLRDADTFHKHLGGSPANIAVNVARLGGRSAVISKTGSGPFGQFLKAELMRNGVITDYLVQDPHVQTSLVFVSRSTHTPDFQAVRDGDLALTAAEIPPTSIIRARVVHTSSFALSREPCRSAIRHALVAARSLHKIISVDPNYSPLIWPDRREALQVLEEALAFADLTKPSLDDAQRLFGRADRPQDYIARFHQMGPKTVVFTMGSDGILLSQAGAISYFPARPVEVRDVTGAGDSFWAGFLLAMLDGYPLDTCTRFAREIVELKLATVGPLPNGIDRAALYTRMEATR